MATGSSLEAPAVADAAVVREALAFAATTIRSGEMFTEQAAETFDTALEALGRLEQVGWLRGALEGIALEVRRVAGILMPPPVDQGDRFETWAFVELLGHRRLVGYVTDGDLAGRRVLVIRRLKQADRARGVGEPDPPLDLEEQPTCYSPAALYSFQALADEAEARTRWHQEFTTAGGRLYNEPDAEEEIPF